jgi:hypothetical protein
VLLRTHYLLSINEGGEGKNNDNMIKSKVDASLALASKSSRIIEHERGERKPTKNAKYSKISPNNKTASSANKATAGPKAQKGKPKTTKRKSDII